MMFLRVFAAGLLALAALGVARAADVPTPTPMQRFVDSNGNACVGCLLFTYQAGTTTKLATYTDATGGTPNTNPIVLNSRGEAQVWLPGSTAYKFVLSPATDSDPPSNPFWTVDQVQTLAAGTFFPNGAVAGDFVTWNSGITAFVDSGYSASSFRKTVPANFYVATTGSDANDCLTLSTPCKTIQHAVDLAASYDLHNGNAIVNVASGNYPDAVALTHSVVGGGTISILGAGAGSTTLAATNCPNGQAAVAATGPGANLAIGGIAVGTTCTGASDLSAFNGGNITFASNDVTLNAAPWALMWAAGAGSRIYSATGFVVAGGAKFGIEASLNGEVAFGSPAQTVVFNNTPTFVNAVFDAIDGGQIDTGGSNFSGSAIGVRYSLANGGMIDTEQNSADLPGDTKGQVSPNSTYYGFQAATITSSTGAGSGATLAMGNGSGDRSGQVQITAGTGAGSSGTVVINTPSQVMSSGAGAGFGYCTANIDRSGGGTWDSFATVDAKYPAGVLTLTWLNNTTALTSGQSYYLNYMCN